MEEKKNNSTKGAAKWKEVLVGGVSGIALGAAGTLFASSIPLDASAETTEEENANPGYKCECHSTDGYGRERLYVFFCRF